MCLKITKKLLNGILSLLKGAMPKRNTAFSGAPCVYYVHAARPVGDASVSVWAGDWPLAVEHDVGNGSVAVFLGTPLGERQDGDAPFWQSESWPQICGEMLVDVPNRIDD